MCVCVYVCVLSHVIARHSYRQGLLTVFHISALLDVPTKSVQGDSETDSQYASDVDSEFDLPFIKPPSRMEEQRGRVTEPEKAKPAPIFTVSVR